MSLFLQLQCLCLSLVPCGLEVWLFLYSGRVVCVSLGTSWPTCQLPAAGSALGLLVGICREQSHSLIQKQRGVSNACFVESRCLCSIYQSRSLASRFLVSFLPSHCPTLVLFDPDFLFAVTHINYPPQPGLPYWGCPQASPAHPPPKQAYPSRFSTKDSQITLAQSYDVSFLQLLENVTATDPVLSFAPRG